MQFGVLNFLDLAEESAVAVNAGYRIAINFCNDTVMLKGLVDITDISGCGLLVC
jgi:hypothetical protein